MRQRGFTLVELVMTMIIIGILAVVALPRFDLLSGFDEIGFRDKVKATLEYARKSAVAQRRYVCVTRSASNLILTIEAVEPENTGHTITCPYTPPLSLPTPDTSCSGSATNRICAPSDVTLDGPATISFSPLGQPTATANCPTGTPVNYCFTVTGDSGHTITVEAETGYVH